MLREIDWNLTEPKQAKKQQQQNQEEGIGIVWKYMEFNKDLQLFLRKKNFF